MLGMYALIMVLIVSGTYLLHYGFASAIAATEATPRITRREEPTIRITWREM